MSDVKRVSPLRSKFGVEILVFAITHFHVFTILTVLGVLAQVEAAIFGVSMSGILLVSRAAAMNTKLSTG